MDFAAAGLLGDLQGAEREARAELLRRLVEDGATEAELQAAVNEDRLALLPVERRLGGRHTAAEVERTTGTPATLMLELRRLLGLPQAGEDDVVFSDEDIAQAHSAKLFLEAGFSPESLSELTLVLGESMSRVAAAVAADFAETFLVAGDSELATAERFVALAEQLTPALEPVLIGSFNAHLREAIHRGMIGQAELESGALPGAQTVSVCFADLVGFTRLGGELGVHELGTVAGRLARLAAGVAEPPVRLIKTIGDAAMLVSPDPAPLVAAALQLVDAVAAEELPTLRAGIAYGPAVQRAGDFYGHTVNLASRVTGIARPGSVLTTDEVRAAAPGAFRWSSAGRHRFKGVHDPVPLHRPHLLEPEDDAPAEAPTPADADSEEASTSKSRAGRRRRRASR